MEEFANYTFSKSKMGHHNYVGMEIIHYDSDNYVTYYQDNNYILVVLSNSQLGIFLTRSEISILKTLTIHQSYLTNESKNDTIIRLPNLIDPRYNQYYLQIPQMLNKPIREWDINFRNLIKEIDPIFPEESLLETDKNEPVLLCKNCRIGYKQSENTNTSCQFHPGYTTKINDMTHYSCCGISMFEASTKYCRIGYHYTPPNKE